MKDGFAVGWGRVAMRPAASAARWIAIVWLTSSLEADVLDPARWRWSNPAPHGNNVLDMLRAGDTEVQVGDAGSVYIRSAGGRWEPMRSGVTNYLRGVAVLGERLLVSGENGVILWSDDWRTFNRATVSPATGSWFEGVTASGQDAIAVGDAGDVYTSATGTNWTRVASGTSSWLRGVAAGGGASVAVGEDGTILRSTSGGAWSRVTGVPNTHYNRVRSTAVAGGWLFVAVGDGGVALSSSNGGRSWSSLNPGTTNDLLDAAFNDTGTLLVGDQEVLFRSNGGTTWSRQTSETDTNAAPPWSYLAAVGSGSEFAVAGRTGRFVEGLLTNAVYRWDNGALSSRAWLWDVTTVANGLRVAVGDLATVLTSLDGLVWPREVVTGPVTNTVLLGVGGNTNLLVAVGNAGKVLVSRAGETNLVVTNIVGAETVITNRTVNTLGVIWEEISGITTRTLQGVGASADRYVLTGDDGVILTSVNGSNWTILPPVTTKFLSGVTAHPGGWVAAGERGALLRAGGDASVWTVVPPATTNWLNRVRWVGDRLVAVGQNGTVLTSSDGLEWAPRTSGSSLWLKDVTYVGGAWYAVGDWGLILSSTNLADWTPVTSPTVKSLYAATAWDGQLLAAGIEGVVLRNQIVPRMTPVDFLAFHYEIVPPGAGGGTNVSYGTLDEVFLLGGQPDQFFDLLSAPGLGTNTWSFRGQYEVFDPSGTLYLYGTRTLTNAPAVEELTRTRLSAP